MKYACLLFTFLLTAVASVPAAEMIPFRSTGWKYVLGTQEASNPTDAWRAISFNDSPWLPAASTASAPIGYPSGDAGPLEASIQTVLPTSAAGSYTCVFLRKTFVVADPTAVVGLNLQVQHDDGFAAWLNGSPIGSANVSEPYTISTLGSDHEVTVGETTLTPSAGLLVAGTNVLAVQVFNSGTASSDLFLDVRLTSAVDDPPVVLGVDPPLFATVQSLTFVNVIFSENVTGVEASDLLINSVAATSVVTNDPRDYTFSFTQPATGLVEVAWIANPGITDIDGVPNAFVPGAHWFFTLDTNAIPAAAIISEFMADNQNTIEDEDGTRSDWIELFNPGSIDVGLNGWFLTDSPTNLTRWRFPAVSLAANKYLLIWASEKNRTNPAAPLHTNFKLKKEAGSYLALVDPRTNVVSFFGGATYPAQQTDISYGRDRVDPNLTGYFLTPTPRAQNATSGGGFAAEPVLSLESGVYTNASLSLVITAAPGTTVRYTLDGTAPASNSTVYTTPLILSNNITVKVRSFPTSGTLFPSTVLVRNFLFLDSTTKDFNSNLPIIVLSTEGRAIAQSVPPGGQRTRGTFLVFDTFRGRSALSRKPDYMGPMGAEVFGQTSAGFAKQPYRIELQDALENDKDVSILGMPAEADWQLRNPFSDKCMMNDFLAYELYEQMGHYSCRRRLVEVFLDQGGGASGRLSYPADYVGIECFLEKIERGKDRLNIAELTPSHTNAPDITGGYIFAKDKDSTGDLNFSAGGQGLKLHEPKPNSLKSANFGATTSWPGAGYTPSGSNQMSYLVSYLNAFNASMTAADWLTRTGTNHYSYYIDVDAFVDQHWIVEFPKQIDGYRLSDYFNKDRNGKLKPEPIWDWNLSFGNADYLQGGYTNTWYYTQLSDADHIWLRRLLGSNPLPNANTPGGNGDPDFIQKVIDRWGVLRTNIMNGDRVLARIDEIATMLKDGGAASSAITRNFAKYPNLNTYLWPNPDGPPDHINYVQPTYDLIISEMKKWMRGHYEWIDNAFPKAPVATIPEGDVTAGSPLVLAGAGTIYYTLDGTDPRASQANGAVAPGALAYAAPITISDNVRVFARARVGTVWSPPTVATYVVRQRRLVITEIMYHPPPPPPGLATNDEEFEYIELRNVESTPLAIGGYTISGGVSFTFPPRTLAVGERVLVVKNQAAFLSRYPGLAASIAGQYTGNLANEGNRLIVRGRVRDTILDFSYDDAWYPITDGFGFSLVINDDSLPLNTWGLASSWRPSGVLNGTPGQGDGAAPVLPHVVINEALTHSDPPPPTDTIELANLDAAPASVAGWYLTDDFRTPKKFRIPLNTPAIPAGGFLLFNESDFNVGPDSFSLSSSGDEVYLFSADAAGELTGYVHGFEFGAQVSGVTFGRYVTVSGQERFLAQTSSTLGSANAGIRVGPIVISEIMYRPPDVFANGDYWNNSEDEYIELRNITGFPVNLYNAAHTSNTWKLDKAVEFFFPSNTTIAANAYVLVVNFNPATDIGQRDAFRAKYGLTAATPLFGPYKGDLANGDETVALYLPDNPETSGNNAGQVPYVLVDEVHYRDQAPWPTTPDGYGQSLHRIDLNAYGDDPSNWAAGGPTAGAPYVSGPSPVVTLNPGNQTVGDSGQETATFAITATGQGPLRYQWIFNGNILNGATSNVLVIVNVKPAQAGQYQCMVLNPFGSALSGAGTLNVLIAPKINQHPVDQRVAEGSNVTFTVIGTTVVPPLRYQWRRNGQDIPGATNFILTLNNVISDVHDGSYSAVLTDANGTITSASATLLVMLAPTIINPNPGGQWLQLTAVPGDNVTLGTQIRGTKPIFLRWRKFGQTPGLLIDHANLMVNTDFAILTNVNAASAAAYAIIMTNVAGGSLGVARTNCVLTVLADSNGNGIPDNWESQYFGSPTGADPDADSDGDGMSNRAEYIAGTNPTDASSYLKVEGIAATGGAVITFQAVSNRTYTVEYKDGLNVAPWTKLTDVAPRNVNWIATVPDLTPSTNRYYRLATPRHP